MGVPPKPTQIFGTPAESYGFENKLLGWEDIPQFVEHCSPLRTSHFRDPVGRRFTSDPSSSSTSWRRPRARTRSLSACVISPKPRHAAVVKAVAEKSAGPRSAKGKGIAFAERNGTAVAVRRAGRGRPR